MTAPQPPWQQQQTGQDMPAGQEPNGQPSAGASGSVRGPRDDWTFWAFWRGDGITMDLGKTLGHLVSNDQDAAELIDREWRPGELHYVPGAGDRPGTWHVWDGRCHKPDTERQAAKLVAKFARDIGEMLAEARKQNLAQVSASMPDSGAKDIDKAVQARWEMWKPAVAYAAKVKTAAGARALLYSLTTPCGVDGSVFEDRHPRWLNCLNVTVDLQTGGWHEHDPADMIAYCVPVPYYWDAPVPEKFCELAWRMTGGNGRVFTYLMRALGYSLLGENPEQVIFFVNGPTKSGKSQILYIVRQLLGPALAHESQAALITVARNDRNARVMNSVRGKRMFTITETSAFMHIDEGQLKRLTGEPVISVDQHYAQVETRTVVTFTGWVATNDMPSLTSYDDAMNERIIVIPGGPTIPPEQRDKRLAERILATEPAQVLAYLVRECVAYHQQGLPMPPEVEAETAKYRGQQNTAAMFTAELCCPNPRAHILMTEARNRYVVWAGKRRVGQQLALQQFYDHMAALPGVDRQDNGGSIRRFNGLEWNMDALSRLLEDV